MYDNEKANPAVGRIHGLEDLQMAKSRWTLVFDTECFAKFGGSKDDNNVKK